LDFAPSGLECFCALTWAAPRVIGFRPSGLECFCALTLGFGQVVWILPFQGLSVLHCLVLIVLQLISVNLFQDKHQKEPLNSPFQNKVTAFLTEYFRVNDPPALLSYYV
jgi:hypothetical protein